jgi:hypothetical protein
MTLLLLEYELESLEVADEALEVGCSGSAPGRWAAEVCSCRRREASAGLDMDFCGGWRRASSGLEGSAYMWWGYSQTGVMFGVSVLKWVDEAGTMLK